MVEEGSDGSGKSFPSSPLSAMEESKSSVPTSPLAEETPKTVVIEPEALRELSPDKKLNRLKFLVERSKIYAGILTERLATPSAAGGDLNTEEVAPTPVSRPAKKQKTTPKPRGRKAAKQRSILEFVSDESKKEDAEKPKLTGRARIASLVEATLKDYQLAGIEWLISLYENGLNGILADEMGLGKTLQTITFLAYLIDQGINGPYLIVGPLSTIQNWMNEFAKFAPQLKVIKYYGSKDERAEIRVEAQKKGSWQVMVTSYEIIMRDAAFLRDLQWKYLIIDEGHRLKNMNCALIKELKSFDSANRLLLTGTPLQNNLAELWSLLNFILPDVFTDLELFQQWFDSGAAQTGGIGEDDKSSLITSLHDILRPFLLRRLKSDVLTFLPPKREFIIYTGLSKQQVELYHKLLEKKGNEYIVNKILVTRGYGNISMDEVKTETPSTRVRRSFKGAKYRELSEEEEDELFRQLDLGEIDNLDKFGLGELSMRTKDLPIPSKDNQTMIMIKQAILEARGKNLQNMVMQLRLACNSPYQFYFPWTDDQSVDERIVSQSGKMVVLEQLANQLVNSGHKFLVFSQFTKTLDLLEEWVLSLHPKWKYCRIDGSVSQEDRQERIDKFNSSKAHKLFLISTRSGGLGINLSAADTVILFDSDWNPQQDLQAMDRVHRIGQKNPVIVVRLATAGTIEEKLLERAAAKRKLEHLVIEEGKFQGFGLRANNEAEAIQEIGAALDTKLQFSKDNREIEPYIYKLSEHDLGVVLDRSLEDNKLKTAQVESDRIVVSS